MARTALYSRKTPGGILAFEDMNLSTGNRFYVDSVNGDSGNSGTSPDDALVTVDAAIAKCTADKGDIIYVAATHAETGDTTSQELFDVDVAGVSIIGLGQGDQRPTFTFTEDSVTVVLGASSCRLSNLRFVSNITDHVTTLEIEAAAVGATVENCYFTDSGTALDCLVFVSIEADADRLRFIDNHFDGFTGGEATDCLLFAGGSDSTIISGNLASGDWKTGGFVNASAAACLGLIIIDNTVVNQDVAVGICYKGNASSTGLIARNMLNGSIAATEALSEISAMHVNQNYMSDAVALTGIISAGVTAW